MNTRHLIFLVAVGLTACGTTEATIVTPDMPVATTVTVAPASAQFSSLGDSESFTATILDQFGDPMSGATATWASSAPGVVSVSTTGVATAVADGTAAITATAGSASGTAAVTVEQVASAVTPSTSATTLGVGSTALLSAAVVDAGASAIPGPTLAWTSDAEAVATVSISGLVTGVAIGSATVTVAATAGGATVTNTVAVTVTAAPPPVTVTTASLPGGTVNTEYGTQSLTATGGTGSYTWALASGSGPLPAGLSLSTNGDITGTPTSAGTSNFTVEVTSGGQTDQQALSIVVVSGASQTIFFTETFEDADVASRGWFGNTTFPLSTTEQYAGSSSLEVHFAAGAQNPDFGGAARILFPATESVYIGYWVKYSSNWVAGAGGGIHEFALITNEDDMWVGPSFTNLTTLIEQRYDGGIVPTLQMVDGANIDQSQIGVDLTGVTEDRATSGCNGETDGYSTICYNIGSDYYNGKELKASQPVLFDQSGPANQNDWHFIEVYFELNSIQSGIGQTDGVAQYWLDGNIIIDLDDVLFRTGSHPTMGFFEFLLAPYIGVGSPVDQFMWVDDLRVGDRR